MIQLEKQTRGGQTQNNSFIESKSIALNAITNERNFFSSMKYRFKHEQERKRERTNRKKCHADLLTDHQISISIFGLGWSPLQLAKFISSTPLLFQIYSNLSPHQWRKNPNSLLIHKTMWHRKNDRIKFSLTQCGICSRE